MQVAFFDFAGTIVKSNPWDYIRKNTQLDERKMRQAVRRSLPAYFGSKLRLVEQARFRDVWLRNMATVFEGWSRDDVRSLFGTIIEKNLNDDFYPDIVMRINQYNENGTKSVIVSGMFTDMTEQIAQKIGATTALGSKLQYQNGICIGTLDGVTCNGQQKIDFMRTYLETLTVPIALNECAGYADSFSDVPLLSAVGEAYAVYPDEKLRAKAIASGWEILE